MKTDVERVPRLTLPRSQIRVLLLEGIHETAAADFTERGYTNLRLEAYSYPSLLSC